MTLRRIFRLLTLLLLCALLPLGTTGCATSVAQWIVRTRNHQGDIALAHGNFPTPRWPTSSRSRSRPPTSTPATA